MGPSVSARPRQSLSIRQRETDGRERAGACVSRDSSNDFACTTPTFTPAFHDLYSSINGSALPSKVEAVLPDQFPLAPTGLFASLVLIASQLLAVVASSISMHLNKKGKGPQWIVKRQPGMRKIATGTGFVGLVLILVTAISLRVQLSDTIKKLEGVGQVGSATLGSGFAREFALLGSRSRSSSSR